MAAYCGIEYFDSPAYPKQYRDKLYMGNIHGGCLNCDRVERSGATYKGFSEPDFLTANDVWFMPVAQKVGPDGCMYVLDWYDRYHCYQDANADPKGVDRGHGRLYRIVHETRPKPKVRDFSKLSNIELEALLSDENIFNRQRSQLKLQERRVATKDAECAKRLQALVLKSDSPIKFRMHALWSLIGSGKLATDFLNQLLDDKSAEIRAWGARTAGRQKSHEPATLERMKKMAIDEDARVRLQASIAAPKLAFGKTESADNVRQQISVLQSSSNDPILPRVVWQNLLPHLLEQQSLVLDSLLHNVDESENLLREIAPRVALRLVSEAKPTIADEISKRAVDSVLQLAGGLSEKQPNLSAAVLESLLAKARTGEIKNDALRPMLKQWLDSNATKKSFGPIGNTLLGKLTPLQKAIISVRLLCANPEAIEIARKIVLSTELDSALRKQMLQAVVSMQPKVASEAMRQLLDELKAARPVDVGYGDAALDAGISLASAEDTVQLVSALPSLKSNMQAAIAERMCRRADTAQALLTQIVDGKLRKELISPNRVRLLAADSNEGIRSSVAKIWGKINLETTRERDEVVTKMGNLLRRDARGDAERGLVVYDRICGQCHVMNGRGYEVGPNITANGRGSYEQLLVSVFNPSLVIGDAYKSVTLRTVDGTVFTGLLVEKSDKRTVIKVQGGKEETIPAEDIEEFKQDKKSLMPEGVENQLTTQELADLFALLTLENPPSAKENTTISGTPANLHSKKRP